MVVRFNTVWEDDKEEDKDSRTLLLVPVALVSGSSHCLGRIMILVPIVTADMVITSGAKEDRVMYGRWTV